MGKDREGAYHPPKGKPSGSGREEGVGLNQPNVGSVENYLNLADKYTEGADEMPVNVRHPNRNVNKGESKKDSKPGNRASKRNKKETSSDDRSSVTPEELPGVLSKEAFAELANFTSDFCVSVYLPTHRTGLEVNTNQDLIPFKNALQEVANTLKGRGIDQAKIQQILEPGYELVRNDSFWRGMSQGLAVFMSESLFKFVKMPDTPTQQVHINNSFMLKQLVNAMTVKEYFYVLVVSKKQVKCFRADAFSMVPVDLPELPSGLDFLEDPADPEYQKLNNSAAHPTAGTFQGHGSNHDNQKELLAQYMEEVDDKLWDEFLHRENAPLVLAGVEYLLPIYRSVSDYKHIWPEVITGSHEHDDINSLFQEARSVMEPYFRERTKKALEGYANQSATALTSSIPADVVPAAHYSRVWHLFVKKDEHHIWGKFDEMENVLTIHEEKQEGDECLVDKAVIKTILNGGDVHFLSREDMPADSPVAALMRY